MHDASNSGGDVCETSALATAPPPPALPMGCGPDGWVDFMGECCSASRAPDGKLAIACQGSTPVLPSPAIGPFYCAACPDGWQAGDGSSSTTLGGNRGVVCCRNDPAGQLCFSQAGAPFDGPTPMGSLPPATPRSCGDAADPGKPSAPVCSCIQELMGHSFALECVGTTCGCKVDGHQVSTITSKTPLCPLPAGGDPLWSSASGCGFP